MQNKISAWNVFFCKIWRETQVKQDLRRGSVARTHGDWRTIVTGFVCHPALYRERDRAEMRLKSRQTVKSGFRDVVLHNRWA